MLNLLKDGLSLLIGFLGDLSPVQQALILPLLLKVRASDSFKVLPLLLPHILPPDLLEVKHFQIGNHFLLHLILGMIEFKLLDFGLPKALDSLPAQLTLMEFYSFDEHLHVKLLLLPFLLLNLHEKLP